MNNIIKKVYVLKNYKNLTIREIKKYIKDNYGISLKDSEIKKYCNYKNINKNQKYSDIMRNKILYLYIHVKNTDSVIKYLANRYNLKITESSLRSLASSFGLNKINKKPTSVRKISKDDRSTVVKMYLDGINSLDIAKKFNYKRKESIYQILEDEGIKRRSKEEVSIDKKSYSDFNIENIDSEFKAYLLGLMFTDGYIYNNKRNGQYYAQLSLKDKDVMEFISQTISCNNFVVKNKNSLLYRIQLHGEKLVNQFEFHGCVQKKTHILKPIINNEELKFFNYILRGAIDGDGWIRKDGKEFFLCSASKDFLEWIKYNMNNIGFVDLKINTRHGIVNNKEYVIYDIRTSKKENIELLKNIIYDKPFGMTRKYNRLHQIKERPSETIIGKSLSRKEIMV